MALFQMAEMATLQTPEVYQPELNTNCKAVLAAVWKSIILMGCHLIFFLPTYC
jgi:hypothetical protein